MAGGKEIPHTLQIEIILLMAQVDEIFAVLILSRTTIWKVMHFFQSVSNALLYITKAFGINFIN